MRPRPQKKREKIAVNKWVLALIFALLVVSIWLLSPSGSSALDRKKENLGLRLGLDLKGGTYIVYQAEFPEGTENKDEAFDATVDLIERRIDEYGVFEPVIQKQEGYRLAVQLPGVTDIEKAEDYIFKPGWLEFRQVEMKGTSTVSLDDYIKDTERTSFFDTSDATLQDANRVFVGKNGEPIVFLKKGAQGLEYVDKNGTAVDPGELDKTALSWMPAVGTVKVDDTDVVKALNGNQHLKNASLQFEYGQFGDITGYAVGIKWNAEGTDLFGQITKRLRDRGSYGSDQRALGILLDNVLISSPQVYPAGMTGDYGDEASITGNFTHSEAKKLASKLNSAFPVSLKLSYGPEVISATLGKDFIDRSVLAGVIGLAVVALFMILYYKLAGVVASLALVIYTILVLAIYKAVGVTMSLAGVAGFIVSLGMAIDANVLIFERLKEELRAGRTVRAAIDTGFNRAWPAIRDSNVTTFIACGILYWFGGSVVASTAVRGFATTLFFGVAVSLFTALVVTRTFLIFFTGPGAEKKLSRFGVEAKDV